jgi:hypothetical protein
MMNDAHVSSKCSGCRSFAVARIAQHVSTLTLVHVALEAHANYVSALRDRQRRVVHLNAKHLEQKCMTMASAQNHRMLRQTQ